MKVFIIIVTCNSMKWIKKCLENLQDSTHKVEILIIDNASTDNTCDFIKTSFPELELILLAKNIGFGAANNKGIQTAYQRNADYFFLLNQDVYIKKDTIDQLLKAHSLDSHFDLISPMHLNGSGTKLDSSFSNYLNPTSCPDFLSDLYLNQLKDHIYPISFVNAAAWLLSRKCVKTVGGFSPAFFQYGEDDNYIQRCHYHGINVGIYGYTNIYHDRENEYKSFRNFKIEQRNRFLHYLNPNNKLTLDFDLRQKKRSYFKLLIQLKLKVAQVVRNEINFLECNRKEIKSQYEKSKVVGLTFLDLDI